MPKQYAEILENYLTVDEPFGPIDAKDIDNPKILELLFERHNKLHAYLHKKPSLIIGRKGSGKTSYLNSVLFDKNYHYVVNLDTSEAFSSVIESISTISKGPVFAESVQKIWKTVIYIGLFSELCDSLPKTYKSKALISDYLAKIGFRDKGTIDEILWRITDVIANYAKEKTYGLIVEVLKIFDNVTFQSTLKTLQNELKIHKQRAVILLDSLDDFQLHTEIVGRAVQGLLKFIGESNNPASLIDIRFCLPAELYHLFMPLSSNPDKDFKRRVMI